MTNVFFDSPPLSPPLDHSVGILSSAATCAWRAHPCHRTGEHRCSIHCSLTHPIPHVIRHHSAHFYSKVSALEILY